MNSVRNEEKIKIGRPAVFLDRDGTLIEDFGYLHDAKDIVWKPETFQALQDLKNRGYLLIMITNQSGVGRGFFSVEDVEAVHQKLISDLKQEDIVLDGIYVCPHAPDDGCGCRKPGTDLVRAAENTYQIDLRKSWFVGDTPRDIETGERCGMRTILVGNNEVGTSKPTYRVQDLSEAAEQILAR